MNKYTVLGNCFDSSGYACHTRMLFNALAKTEDVKLITSLTPDWPTRVNDKELEAIKKPDEYDRIKLIITHPLYWRPNCTNKRNWVYCIWEGNKVPEYFIGEMLNPEIEYILVPSTHTKQAIVNTVESLIPGMCEKTHDIIYDKIKVIPHGVDLDLFKPGKIEHKEFTFLVNKGFRGFEDRGGTQYALQAYIEEFTNKDNVELIVKINPAYGIPDMDKIIKAFAKDRTDLPKMRLDFNNYDYKDLINLYNQADIFVSTTRSEAFNLPCIEALACGVPVITTDYGGQEDYVNQYNGWLVDYKLEEVQHEIAYEGISWATPDIEHIRAIMRSLYNNPTEVVLKSECSRESIKHLTWDNTAKLINSLK